MQKILSKIDSFFGISKKGSTFGREIIAGCIVFLAMIYILPVNTSILSSTGMSEGAIFAATAICSAICTIFMGVVARFPVALSAGMGMNAFFAFTVCGQMGYTWEEALALTFVSGIIFFVFTLTPIRKKIINAIPKSLKHAISAGLGAFIAFVGLKMGGVIALDSSTLVKLGDLSNPVVLLSVFGIILTFCLLSFKGPIKKFAIVIGMAATAILGLVLGACGVQNMPSFSAATGSVTDISLTFGKCFGSLGTVLARPESYALIFSLIFVNLFDTTATLLAVGKDAGIMDDKGELIGGKKAMIADASGAVICGILGTSTVTSFAESTIGVESGGKTGLSATTTGILFLLTLLIYPAFSIFSGVTIGTELLTPVTSLALVAVGGMMFSHIKDIDWEDKIAVYSTFLTFLMMILTYSVSKGLSIGLIFYVLMKLISGKGKEVSIILYIMAAFFLANFFIEVLISNNQLIHIFNMYYYRLI